jgi:hypothetical protein
MTSPRRRKSPTLSLKLGEETFRVERKNLFENLGLFQENPSLLSASDYEVRTPVPRDVFAAFVSIIEGGPITLSEENYESFGLLSLEFRFKALSDACFAFMELVKSRERVKDSSSEGAVSVRNEVKIGVGHGVTIYSEEGFKRWEVLRSMDEVDYFVSDLKYSKRRDIVIDGMPGQHRVVEKAVAAVYSNTAADLPDDETHKGFLLLILQKLQALLCRWSMESCVYCLHRAHAIAPTGFDQARLMLLSQCDPACPDEFVPLPNANWDTIESLILMLQKEKNGKAKEANQLLRKLEESGRYESALRGLMAGGW